jgi:hypothetical protein
MIAGGQLEATSGISRLLWGMGVWNQHLHGTVALAASEYELPPILPGIAAHPSPIWHKEHHPQADTVTYRTAHYMLSSAQDYCPGQPGHRQHIWQATLGPDAVVFVNHPPCISQDDARRPNFWAGNRVLPRVAQWQDVLVALYDLPDDDWLGFTHAYFPAHAFDEYRLDDGWAFARAGDGYLALTASQGLDLVTRGPSAYREIRSHGSPNVWFCHMGSAESDGSFDDFCHAVSDLALEVDGLSLAVRTLRGQELAFGWDDPLSLDGDPQPISAFDQFEGPFCQAPTPAPQIDIQYGGYSLRLDFSLPEPSADGEQA